MAVSEKSLTLVKGGLSDFPPEKVEVIRRTVAKGATNDELEMFLYLAARYNLDPFLKEIWCIKRQKKGPNGQYIDDPNTPAVITTSRDGYLKIAQSDSNFEGIKSFVVKEGDTFEIDAESDKVIHKFGAKRGKILGAWAVCYHKQRRPAVAFVDFQEYNGGSPIWQKYPSAMIQKVAEVSVLKRQFSISGLVAQEEMTAEFELTAASTPQVIEDPKARWKQSINELNALAESYGMTGDDLRGIGQGLFGKHDPKMWTLDDIEAVKQDIMSAMSTTPEGGVVAYGTAEDELPNSDDLPF